MEYYSITQIAKDLNKRISGGITIKDVQWALRHLGYIDRNNRPTLERNRFYSRGAHIQRNFILQMGKKCCRRDRRFII